MKASKWPHNPGPLGNPCHCDMTHARGSISSLSTGSSVVGMLHATEPVTSSMRPTLVANSGRLCPPRVSWSYLMRTNPCRQRF
eukprot:6471791-Amphidinium_carterae.5